MILRNIEASIFSSTSQIVGPSGAADLRVYAKIISALPCVSNYSHCALTCPRKEKFSSTAILYVKICLQESRLQIFSWYVFRMSGLQKNKFILTAFFELVKTIESMFLLTFSNLHGYNTRNPPPLVQLFENVKVVCRELV